MMRRIGVVLASLMLFAYPVRAEKTVTVGDAGSSCNPCTYATLALAEDGEDGDVQATDPLYVDCYEMNDTATTTIQGWTSDHGVYIRGAASDRTASNTGIFSDQRYRRTNSSASWSVRLVNNGGGAVPVYFQDLQFETAGTGAGSAITVSWGHLGAVSITGSVFKDTGTYASTNMITTSADNIALTVSNNIVYDAPTAVYLQGAMSTSSTIVNNTFVGNAAAVAWSVTDLADVVYSNNISADCGASGCFDGTAGQYFSTASDNNYNEGGEDPDNSLDNDVLGGAEPTFVDKVGKDFHLGASDTVAMNTGATIAAVTTDIDGHSRPQGAAYDRGADEVLASGSPNRRRMGGVPWQHPDLPIGVHVW